VKLRPVLYVDAEGMKCSGLGGLRLEAENVLAMYLFADQLDGVLQTFALQKRQLMAAGAFGEEVGQIGLVQADQFTDPLEIPARP
jgi:hypothetical protein